MNNIEALRTVIQAGMTVVKGNIGDTVFYTLSHRVPDPKQPEYVVTTTTPGSGKTDIVEQRFPYVDNNTQYKTTAQEAAISMFMSLAYPPLIR